jgi:Fic-DOC domain mobile mystery protein B
MKRKIIFTIEFLKKLHKKLFGDVWLWAGKFRLKEVNLSNTRPYDVGPNLKMLFEDVKVWIKAKNIDWDEIAAEFHHRLVRIHPFPNGNGRTTRIFIEFFQKRNGQEITSWMASLKNSPKGRREKYIQSLRKADKGDYSELIKFMKEKRKSKV